MTWRRRPKRTSKFQPKARPRWWLAAIVIVVVAAATLGAVVHFNGPDHCAAGVTRLGGDCIGVSDNFAFDPALKKVVGDIHRENLRILRSKAPYVTVAFAGPLSSTGATGLTAGRIAHELEGAFVGQLRANSGDLVGDHPQIRLVLANEGSNEGHWQPVAHQLEKMVGTKDHLVTTVGLGLSQQETVDFARELSRHDPPIPMVADVVTADGIDSTGAGHGGPIPGLIRVAPSVSEEVAGIGHYLHTVKDMRKAMLVTDTTSGDFYTQSLSQDFHTQLAGYLHTGGDIEELFTGRNGNEFAAISADLCGATPPDMVLYAGREVALPTFLDYLQHRPCHERPLTLVTGSDATALPASTLQAPISVVYAALADPHELNSSRNPQRRQYQFFTQAFGRQFSLGDLSDGWATMAHDAVLTAAKAIRLATSKTSTVLPDLVSIGVLVHDLQVHPVPGATGDLQIPPTGNPVHRPITILRLGSTGISTLVNVYTP